MTEPAAHQPEPAPCLAEEDRDGTPYICTQPAGHHPQPHKMVKQANMSAKLRAARDARTVVGLVEVDTARPLDQRPTGDAIVKSTSAGSGNDLAYRDLIKIVNTAETLRFEGQTTIELYSLIDQFRRVLDQARAQEGERQPVDAAIIRQLPDIGRRLQTQVEGWTLQRGIREDGGS